MYIRQLEKEKNMRTFKFSGVEQYIVKVAVANMLAEMIRDDEEELSKVEEFMKGWMERVEKEDEDKSISTYLDDNNLAIPSIIELLKKLDTKKEKK
jgi:hypothetical protein